MNWFVYIVRCADDSLYTGISIDIKRRILQHNSKQGAKSLFGKLPVKLVYFEKYKDHTGAAKREREIKGWRRDKKLELVSDFFSEGFYPEE